MAKKIKELPFMKPMEPKRNFDTKESSKLHSKLDEHQLEYFNALQEYNIVTCDSPAGTGKRADLLYSPAALPFYDES